MAKIKVNRLVSKEGDVSLNSWETILFDELSQVLRDTGTLRAKKYNDTEKNFEYSIKGIVFSDVDYNNLVDTINELPHTETKRKLIDILTNG